MQDDAHPKLLSAIDKLDKDMRNLEGEVCGRLDTMIVQQDKMAQTGVIQYLHLEDLLHGLLQGARGGHSGAISAVDSGQKSDEHFAGSTVSAAAQTQRLLTTPAQLTRDADAVEQPQQHHGESCQHFWRLGTMSSANSEAHRQEVPSSSQWREKSSMSPWLAPLIRDDLDIPFPEDSDNDAPKAQTKTFRAHLIYDAHKKQASPANSNDTEASEIQASGILAPAGAVDTWSSEGGDMPKTLISTTGFGDNGAPPKPTNAPSGLDHTEGDKPGGPGTPKGAVSTISGSTSASKSIKSGFSLKKMASIILTPVDKQANLSAVRAVTTDTDGYAHDARAHWRQHIRKKYQKRKYFEPLSLHSKREAQGKQTIAQRIVRSRMYEFATILLVVSNAIFIAIQVEYFALTESRLAMQSTWETVFLVLFTVDLLFRLLPEGVTFFTCHDRNWNLFDLIVVVSMLGEVLLQELTGASGMLLQMSTLRVLRVVRVLRILRVIRVMKFFRELRTMIHAILSSCKSLTWVMMCLALLFFIFGISLTQGVAEYCANHNLWNSKETEEMRKYFGTLGRSFISLYEGMSGGISWGELLDALGPLHFIYHFVFMIFISFAIFAVVNIVTGVFVESAMQCSQHDREVVISEQLRTHESYLDNMQQVFHELDMNKDGHISLSEFRFAIKDPRVVAYFTALGLDITEVHTLYVLLDRDQKGHVDIEEFLLGCLRLKGEARSLDVAKLQYDCEWLVHNMETLVINVENLTSMLAPSKVHHADLRAHSNLGDHWKWSVSNSRLSPGLSEIGE